MISQRRGYMRCKHLSTVCILIFDRLGKNYLKIWLKEIMYILARCTEKIFRILIISYDLCSFQILWDNFTEPALCVSCSHFYKNSHLDFIINVTYVSIFIILFILLIVCVVRLPVELVPVIHSVYITLKRNRYILGMLCIVMVDYFSLYIRYTVWQWRKYGEGFRDEPFPPELFFFNVDITI